nr:MAG TPA: hypothetical protein [Caudoviricetes sp.]
MRLPRHKNKRHTKTKRQKSPLNLRTFFVFQTIFVAVL